MSDHRDPQSRIPKNAREQTDQQSRSQGDGKDQQDPLVLIDECLAAFSPDDPRQQLLYKVRHLVLQGTIASQQRDTEFKKLTDVVEKLTAPANRIGTLLELPGQDVARIVVGGAEYFTNVDSRVGISDLKVGTQVLVNEAFAVIKTLGYDRSGPILKIGDVLADGRLRFEQEAGRQALILQRSSDLEGVELRQGDEVRLDPSNRIALERFESRAGERHLLDEVPTGSWEEIGGQQEAISAIRKAIEYPLLHAETFQAYQFVQPKGFLLHGPPGCGKTLIGRATAASLAKLMQEAPPQSSEHEPVTHGVFLYVKGPEILNMWLGESERMVRDLFAQARLKRAEGALPFIFIDEAEAILGTRRAMRSFNITNTLVPMFCSEMDGVQSLHDVVIILASNRPDLIDPAVLRPGRIDRKIKVSRPSRAEAEEILKIYIKEDLPLHADLLEQHNHDASQVREILVATVLDSLFARSEDQQVLSIRLRNGQRRTLYRGDLVSGAILASIVQRAKERAIERTVRSPEDRRRQQGLMCEDVLHSVEAEFSEGELLPPDDTAEEWLKLLDHHPEQVVGVSSMRKGRAGKASFVGHII